MSALLVACSLLLNNCINCLATESQSEAKIKTWFIVRRLFNVATSDNDVTAAAAAAKTLDENKTSEAVKIPIDGDSMADGQSKEKVC